MTANDAIHVRGLRLCAPVGGLEPARRDDHSSSRDISLWTDLSSAAAADDLSGSLAYSLAIRSLQALAREIRCLTIEHFSDRVLDRLEQLYGVVPMRLTLSKCAAPVPGFDGVVAVERARHGAP